MPNLRVISDNAIDRATLTASTTETNFSAASLQSQRKSDVWRSAMGTSVQLRALWPTPESLQAVVLPFCNLSPTATMRVRVSTEASTTNLLKATENFDNTGAWVTYYGIAAVPDATSAPDGTLSADALYPIAGTGATGGALYASAGTIPAGTYTFSLYVKAGSQTSARLGVATSGAIFNSKVFNLLDSISSSGANWKQEKLSNGWWRLSVLVTPNASSTFYCNIGFGSSQAAAAFPSPYLYVWGAQFESGAVATSYYPSQDFLNSRASTATYINNVGNLVVAGVNVPRFSYNPNNLSAPAQPLFEAAATNLVTASGTLTTGWTGAITAVPAASTYRGLETYRTLTKTTSTTSEQRGISLGAVSAGSKLTATIALRAGTKSQVSVGLYDTTSGGPLWGANADAICTVLEGPGVIGTQNGGMFNITNLSATADTLISITRNYATASTGAQFLIYPDTSGSVTIGASILATRVQVEAGSWPTSYIPTTTTAVTRAADVWTSNAATRPTGYIDTWQSYAYDSGDVLACPAPAVTLRGFTAAQAASAYAFGGGACARHWMPAAQQAYGLAVDITDTNNAAGYLESAQMIVGAYWEPSINFDYGASAQLVDSSKNERNDAGDLISDAGTVSRRVSLSLSKLSPTDRATLWSILRSSGARYPIFLSMFPEHSDLALERDHQVYGKLVQLPAMALPFFNTASATVEVESI